MPLYKGFVTKAASPNLRIRKPNKDGSLNINGMTIAGILPLQTFTGDNIVEDTQGREWMHLIEANGKAIDGWSAEWYLEYDPVDTVPTEPPVPAGRPLLGRILHDIEMGSVWRKKLPEVQPLFPNCFVPFTEPYQRVTVEANPLVRPKQLSAVFDGYTAITNHQGFGMKGDKRANFILHENLKSPLPKLEDINFGGNIVAITGTYGDWYTIDTLDGRRTPPSVLWLLARRWYLFDCVSVDSRGTPRMFPQGKGHPVRVPFITDKSRFPVLKIHRSKIEIWTAPQLPDVYKVYHPK